MRHGSNIASLINEVLGRTGRAAVMKTLPVMAAEKEGLWVIRLHRVPSRLQVDAILQEQGNVIKASIRLPEDRYCWPGCTALCAILSIAVSGPASVVILEEAGAVIILFEAAFRSGGNCMHKSCHTLGALHGREHEMPVSPSE